MQAPILILGASSTLGGAIARKLSKDGRQLILHGFKGRNRLRELASECDGAQILTADLTNENSVKVLFDEVSKIQDGLSGLIFSVAEKFAHKLTHRTQWSEFQAQFDSQLKAFHFCLTEAMPLLKSSESEDSSRVIVLSTEYAIGIPPLKITPYVVAKSALTSYAKVIAQEWLKHNVRVHILAPGMVKSNLTAEMPEMYLKEFTKMMPEKCLTSVMDVASVASFLMTEAADSLYGTVIPVTRGNRQSL